MSDRFRPTFPLIRTTALVVAAFGACAAAHADADEELPLFLTLSQSVRHDSNFSRTEQARSDTVSVTSVGGGLNKAYGRQTYRGSAKLTKSSYAHYGDLLNNNGKNVNGTVSSEFLRDWMVTVGGRYEENLNQITDNNDGDRVVRNIRIDGDINGVSSVGGLVGVNQGTIDDVTFHASVSGEMFVGGVAGVDYEGSVIQGVTVSGDIAGEKHVGGVVGISKGSAIDSCMVSAHVQGGVNVGGVVGWIIGGDHMTSSIKNCSFSGEVKGSPSGQIYGMRGK